MSLFFLRLGMKAAYSMQNGRFPAAVHDDLRGNWRGDKAWKGANETP